MKCRILRNITLLFLVCMIFGKAHGIEDYRFRTYRVEDGLSQNTVWCSLQDHEGFIWFGTKDGLNRYDGNQSVVFRHNPSDKGSIGNNFIRSLYEEENCRSMLVGTDDGLYRLSLITWKFEKIELPVQENLQQTAINSICRDHDGRIWIGTFGHGIYRMEKEGVLPVKFRMSGIPECNKIWKIFCDSDGVVWIGTLEGGLLRYDKGKGLFDHYGVDEGVSNDIYEVYEDTGGRLWVGTWNSGLKWLERERNSFHHTPITGDKCEAIRSITEIAPGRLLVGCNNGLFEYDIHKTEYKKIPLAARYPDITVNDGIYSFLHDSEGGLWIGGYFAGVNYIHPDFNMFEHYRLAEDSVNTVGHIVSDMVEASNDRLWIATEDNGLASLDRRNKKVYFVDNAKLSHLNIHSIMLDGDELWAGNISGTIDVLNLKNGSVRHYGYTEGLDAGGIYSIFKSTEGVTYVGGINGLLTYDKVRNRFVRVGEFPCNAYVYDIKQTANGILWIATYGNGIFTYNPRMKIWRNFLHNPNDEGSLPSNKIICLNTSDSACVWVGSEGGGLSMYSLKDDRFTTVDTRDGLPNNVIYGVELDHSGNIWLSTNMGLSSYNPQTRFIKSYFYKDGIQSSQFNYKASLALADSMLCFGGIGGLNIFKPDRMVESQNFPPIKITSYVGKGKDDSHPEKHMLPYVYEGDRPHVDLYDTNTVSLEFVGLSFKEPRKTRYAYRLIGVDKDWVMSANDNKAVYHNLNAGKYMFEVKGTDYNGVWNPYTAVLELEIHPPFYKSTSAYIVYILVALGLICWVVYIYMMKMKRRNQISRLRSERDRQYEYYEGQLNFFTRMVHEIRTPLTLINASLEDIVHRYTDDSDFLETVEVMENNTTRLLSLVNDLLDFRKGTQGLTLNFTLENIGEVLTEIHRQMLPYANKKNVEISLRLPEAEVKAGVDSNALRKIIVNLLFNAIKYTRTKVDIELMLDRQGESFVILVGDDGSGIKEEDRAKIFTLYYRVKMDETMHEGGSGIGLAIVKHYVDAHKGLIEVLDNQPVGSVFKVSIPLSLHDMRTEPASPVSSESASPVSSESASPVSSESASPVSSEPASPVSSEPASPVSSESASPVSSEPASTVSSEPASPVSSESASPVSSEVEALEVEVLPQEEVDERPEAESETAEKAETDNDSEIRKIEHINKIGRVLVVEDNDDLCKFLVRKLSSDYEVISAENGKIAISLLVKYEIDLVITDVLMAEMDGLELCRQIKSDSRLSHIKVVLLTACANESVKSQGYDAGADAYIEKPFAFSALKTQVQSLFENKSRLIENLIGYPWYPYNALVSNSVDNEFLTKINDLIEANLTSMNFDVDMMASEMNMSRSTMHRKIKGITNLTPNDYIRLYRLKKSAMYLMTGRYKVAEVCFMVGFNTPSYFSKCFHAQFGIMPKDFLTKISKDFSVGK